MFQVSGKNSQTVSIAPRMVSANQATAFLQARGSGPIAATQVNARTTTAVTIMAQLLGVTRVFQVSGKNRQPVSIAPRMVSANQATAFLQARGSGPIAATQVNARTTTAVTIMAQL